MKIAFIPGTLNGTGYYRSVVPGLALRERGHELNFVDKYEDPWLRKADVIMATRQVGLNALEVLTDLAYNKGIPFVHDIDDNFHAIPESNPSSKHEGNGKRDTLVLEEFNKRAAVLSVSTIDLAQCYAKANPQIAVCPNAADDARVKQFAPTSITGLLKRPGQIRIGWAGSATHVYDFRLIAKPLRRLLEEFPDLRLVFLGDDLRGLISTRFEMVYKQLEFAGDTFSKRVLLPSMEYRSEQLPTLNYYRKIKELDLDIGVAPIESTLFNRCKSYLKVLEYGMLGIPAIASNHGPYRQYANESPNREVVFLAGNETEWSRRLRLLITDDGAREQLARNNLAYVLDQHVISKKVQLWEDTLSWGAGLLAPASSH